MGCWAVAGRSTSSLIRTTWRTTTAAKSSFMRIPLSASSCSRIRPNLTLHRSPISPPSSEMFVRRQLSSLLPLHCAIASAKLVSKLPSEATSTSTEGRFANYLSPI